MASDKRFKAIRDRIAKSPLGHGKFGRNVLTVFAGTASAQIIAIASMPLLARLFTPSDFGVLASYAVLAQMVAILGCLGYQNALIAPKRQDSAGILLYTCLLLLLGVAAISGVTFIVFAEPIATAIGMPELAEWLWLAPVSVIALSGFEIMSMWSARNKTFAEMSSATVKRRLTITGGQIALGASSSSGSGLILGQVFGNLAGFLVLARSGLKRVPAGTLAKFRISRVRTLLYRYRQFPGFGLLATFSGAIARNLPIIGLGFFFSPAVVGFFSMAYRLVAAPVQVGATSLTNVFFERANRALRDGDLASLTITTYQRLVIVILTPMMLLAIASPELINLILGDRWAEAGIYLRWISLWMFFAAVSTPMHKIFVITERQNELAMVNIAMFTITGCALAYGGNQGDAHQAVALFCICSSLAWLLVSLRVVRISGGSIITALKILAIEVCMALPFGLALMAVRYLSKDTWLVTFAFGALLMIFGISRVRQILSGKRHK